MKTKRLLIFLVFGLVLHQIAEAGPLSTDKPTGTKNAFNPQSIVEASKQMRQSQDQMAATVRNELEGFALKKKIDEQIDEHSRPEILIPLFIKQLHQIPAEAFASLKKQSTLTSAALGVISGKVTISNANPTADDSIYVLAFDVHGYYASRAKVNNGDSRYSISNLKAGEYYVMTYSKYVDEIYDNLLAPLDNRETWRAAKKVTAIDGTTTENINFDLQSGARISGRIFTENGITPLQDEEVEFVITKKESSLPIFRQSYYTMDGTYSLNIPIMGDIKISVKANGYSATWSFNASNWTAAAVIAIPDFKAIVNNIDFVLVPDPAAALLGGITGTIQYSDQPVPPFLSVFYAFNIADTSFETLTIGLFGSYSFENLPQGQYFIYGNDLLGNLLGGSNYMGQYYLNQRTPDKATAVSVKAGQTTEGINFVLEKGGLITGRITNELGGAVDSVLVMAFDSELTQFAADPFLTKLAIYLCMADDQGRYRLEGLPSGSYYVRTISDSILDIDQLGIKLQFKKHQGQYVDEYYGDAQNIFYFSAADKVPVIVANETAHIDFVLEKAKYFTGTVTDASTGNPITNVLLFALNDTSGYPQFSFSTILRKNVKLSGNFKLGPLPAGKYKLLVVAGGLEFKTDYLSEYYDGVRDFKAAPTLQLGQNDYGNINFTLDHGGIIQGFIDIPEGLDTYRAGADTLDGFPVLVFDANSGLLANLDFVQFTGGYRVDHLLPGVYKILALPTLAPFAATYYGGGDTFTDPACQTVTIGYGEVKNCDIKLEIATGTIAGHVFSKDNGIGLSQIMVIAYDASGHPSGLAISDMDLASGTISENAEGVYTIEGLRSGKYYLRTWALSSVMGLSEQILGLASMLTGGINPMALLGNLGQLTSLFNINLGTYQDQWYQNIPATTQLDLKAMLFNLTGYGIPSGYDNALLPLFIPIPVAEKIPANAAEVEVVDGVQTSGKSYWLETAQLVDWITGVSETKKMLPTEFSVTSNYPNPFNPRTQFSFSLPQSDDVSIVVYNLSGQRVKELLQKRLQAGNYVLAWDGTDDIGFIVPAGLYFAQVTANGMKKTIKMTLLK